MKKRCFLGINLPQNIKWQIEGLISDIKNLNLQNKINYTQTKNIHITLIFLDELDKSQLERAQAIFKESIEKFPTTEIITNHISAFPDIKNPLILYLGVQEYENKILNSIYNQLTKDLKKMGLNIEQKNWTPHITLGRIKFGKKIIVGDLNFPEINIEIKKIDLMESQLTPDGPEYKILNSYYLKT